MHAATFTAPKTPAISQINGRCISPWLDAASEIYMTYFDKVPTTLSLLEVRNEVIQEYCDLPIRELAAVLALVDTQYNDMVKRLRLVK